MVSAFMELVGQCGEKTKNNTTNRKVQNVIKCYEMSIALEPGYNWEGEFADYRWKVYNSCRPVISIIPKWIPGDGEFFSLKHSLLSMIYGNISSVNK